MTALQYLGTIPSLTPDTLAKITVPYIDPAAVNPMKAHAVEFLKNGRIQRRRIKEHPNYPYSFLYILANLVFFHQPLVKKTLYVLISCRFFVRRYKSIFLISCSY